MTLGVCESKTSDKVVKFVALSAWDLTNYCSLKYAKRIIEAHDNGQLWGVYFTKTGRIKATFC